MISIIKRQNSSFNKAKSYKITIYLFQIEKRLINLHLAKFRTLSCWSYGTLPILMVWYSIPVVAVWYVPCLYILFVKKAKNYTFPNRTYIHHLGIAKIENGMCTLTYLNRSHPSILFFRCLIVFPKFQYVLKFCRLYSLSFILFNYEASLE